MSIKFAKQIKSVGLSFKAETMEWTMSPSDDVVFIVQFR